MGVEQKRKAIADVYDGIRWKERVAKMQPNQVCAIYNKFLYSGKFDEVAMRRKKAKEPVFRQMTIFDFLKEDIYAQ